MMNQDHLKALWRELQSMQRLIGEVVIQVIGEVVIQVIGEVVIQVIGQHITRIKECLVNERFTLTND